MLEVLASHGFTNAAVVNEEKAAFVMRIRTGKGWVYERFPKDDLASVDAWAIRNEPESE